MNLAVKPKEDPDEDEEADEEDEEEDELEPEVGPPLLTPLSEDAGQKLYNIFKLLSYDEYCLKWSNLSAFTLRLEKKVK